MISQDYSPYVLSSNNTLSHITSTALPTAFASPSPLIADYSSLEIFANTKSPLGALRRSRSLDNGITKKRAERYVPSHGSSEISSSFQTWSSLDSPPSLGRYSQASSAVSGGSPQSIVLTVIQAMCVIYTIASAFFFFSLNHPAVY